MLQNVRIAGTGSYLPPRIVTNDELSSSLDTTDEWIVSHTGIRQRHVAGPEESASTMGAIAARNALEDAGIAPEELSLVVVTTCTGDYANFPSTACLVQNAVGAANAGCMDLNAACAGFTCGLSMARAYCRLHGRPVLVVSSEAMSRVVDWQDRSTCILFGDGAGAAVLTPSDEPGMIHDCLGADGSGARSIYRECGARLPADPHKAPGALVMQGRAVFPFAVRAMEGLIRKMLAETGTRLEDVAHVIPHQANLRILEAVAKRMDVPVERFFINIGSVANTSSASVPIAMDQLSRSGAMKDGDLVLTVAFGAGLSFGGNMFRWRKRAGEKREISSF